MQRAWLEVDVPQCGYCQSGQIMTAVGLLKKTAHPTDADIDEAMHGNICRCGTYQAIRHAVHLAAQYQAAANRNADGRAERSGRRRSMSATLSHLNRRGFLKAGVATAGGLFIGFHLPESSKLEAATTSTKLNAFIHVGSDDIVTFTIHKSEMGQGPMTSLSQLLAEELDCDWKQIRTEFAPVDPAYGPLQGTFGSMSIRTCWDPMRKAGASARDMLLDAAAQQWGVAKSQLRTEKGQVINTVTNARLSYGSLADAAGKLPAPAKVAVKDPKDFHLIGTSPKRLDTPLKVNGSAGFGIDARRPGMVYAVVARCPVFGGKVASFDDTKTKAVPGVSQVVRISQRNSGRRRQYLVRHGRPARAAASV